MCRGLLRHLAGNREVFVASWGERDVIVKVFYKRVTGRYRVRKEWKGLNLLRDRGTNAPKPLFYGRTEAPASPKGYAAARGNWAIVTERIVNSHPLNEIFNNAARKEKVEIMKRVCTELAQEHEKGIVQKDLHLGNFLQDGEKLVVLDPAQMRFSKRPIGKTESISQLALITSNMAKTEGVKEIWEEYFNRRGWQLEEPDERLLEAKTAMYKRKGLKRGLKKTLRTSKRFVRTKAGDFVAVFTHEFYAQEQHEDFIKRINELITYNGKDVAVERYAYKGFLDSLCQTIMGSRAKKGWLAGYRLRLLGKISSKPVAFIERRKGGLVWESYLVTERI